MTREELIKEIAEVEEKFNKIPTEKIALKRVAGNLLMELNEALYKMQVQDDSRD